MKQVNVRPRKRSWHVTDTVTDKIECQHTDWEFRIDALAAIDRVEVRAESVREGLGGLKGQPASASARNGIRTGWVDVFNTKIRVKHPPEMCLAQARLLLADKYNTTRTVEFPGTAGVAARVIDHNLRKIKHVLTNRAYLELALAVCTPLWCRIQDPRIGPRGEMVRVRVRFPDNSELILDGDGYR